MLLLDHLAVAGETLQDAVALVEGSLGVAMRPGGTHARYGTHNQLLGLADGLYLEAIAINPDAAPPQDARWFDLDRFTGHARLSNWAIRTHDIAATLAAVPSGAGRAVALQRGDLRWRMAVPQNGILPMEGCFPTFLQWDVSPIPGETLPASGCRLIRLEIAHPEASALTDLVPFSDPRVHYVDGPVALRATIDTPHGIRILQ